jgi:hypothetical protein
VHKNQAEKGFVDIGLGFEGLNTWWWHPVWVGKACLYNTPKGLDGWTRVGLEKSGIDLTKDITDSLRFIRELD